jgi:putative ATP-binding cassette transporter
MSSSEESAARSFSKLGGSDFLPTTEEEPKVVEPRKMDTGNAPMSTREKTKEREPLLRKRNSPPCEKKQFKGPVFVDESEEAHQKNISISQLRPFLTIAIPFFRHDRGAICSLIGLVALTLINSAMMVVFSFVKRGIFDALNEKDEHAFYNGILSFFLVLVIAVPIYVFYDYLRLWLALHWRKALTMRVLEKYYTNRNYYVIECCHDIDNPDQRIAEDLNEFTSTSLELFFIAFDALMSLLTFSVVLFRIFPMLFVSIIIYALIGTFITARLGKSLVGLYYQKLQKEADFRFGLIRTRENAEGIAFYDSEATLEKINLWKLFERVLENQLCIIRTQRNLEFFTTSYDYFTFLIPYVVVAPLYFRGQLDLGAITQSSEAFYYVRTSFSIIVSNFEKLSAFSAGE